MLKHGSSPRFCFLAVCPFGSCLPLNLRLQSRLQVVYPCPCSVAVSLASSCVLFSYAFSRFICSFVPLDASIGRHLYYLDLYPPLSLELVYKLYCVSHNIRTSFACRVLKCPDSCSVVCEDN
jgi:hypothetical protein